MPKMLDADCSACDFQVRDLFLMRMPDRLIHFGCGGTLEPVYAARPQDRTQWDDKTMVLVFKNPDGSIRYPGRNDVKTPEGCERVEIRSLHALDKFCRDNHVVNHAAHYDSNGRSFDGH